MPEALKKKRFAKETTMQIKSPINSIVPNLLRSILVVFPITASETKTIDDVMKANMIEPAVYTARITDRVSPLINE